MEKLMGGFSINIAWTSKNGYILLIALRYNYCFSLRPFFSNSYVLIATIHKAFWLWLKKILICRYESVLIRERVEVYFLSVYLHSKKILCVTLSEIFQKHLGPLNSFIHLMPCAITLQIVFFLLVWLVNIICICWVLYLVTTHITVVVSSSNWN